MPSQVIIAKKSSRITVILPGDRRLTFSPGEDLYAEADPNDSNKIFIKTLDTNDIFVGPLFHTQYRDSSGVVFDATRDAVVIALNAILNPDDVTLESDSNGDIILDPNGTGEITLTALAGAINLTSNDINIGDALEIDSSAFKITCARIDTFGISTLPGSIAFYDADDSNYVRLAIPQTVAADYTLKLPGADGSNGQAMVTDGSGNLSFSTIADTNLGNSDQTISGDREIKLGQSTNSIAVRCGYNDSLIPLKVTADGAGPATTEVAGNLIVKSGAFGSGGTIQLMEYGSNGTHVVSLEAPVSLAADYSLVLPASDGSNGQALVTDGSGNLSFSTISGGGGGSDVIKHFYSGGAQLAYPYSRYLPLTGDVIEQNTASSALSRTGFVAPYDGEVKKIIARSQETLGNTVLQWYKATDGTHAPATSLQSVTVNINAANTSFTYTYSTATFSKGDILSLKVDPTSDPVSTTMEFNYIIEFEFDTST